MNRKEWHAKFFTYNAIIENMLVAIPNFSNHKDSFVIAKSMKYYGTINTISLKILENRNMPYMKLTTYGLDDKIEQAKNILRIQLEKRNIPNKWASLLPNIDEQDTKHDEVINLGC